MTAAQEVPPQANTLVYPPVNIDMLREVITIEVPVLTTEPVTAR